MGYGNSKTVARQLEENRGRQVAGAQSKAALELLDKEQRAVNAQMNPMALQQQGLLAQQGLGLQAAGLTNQYNLGAGQLGLQAQLGAGNLGIQQGQLGLQQAGLLQGQQGMGYGGYNYPGTGGGGLRMGTVGSGIGRRG
jgi:hypothetical protein